MRTDLPVRDQEGAQCTSRLVAQMAAEKRAWWVLGAKSVNEASSSRATLRQRARQSGASVSNAKRMKRRRYLALDKCAHATAGVANDFD